MDKDMTERVLTDMAAFNEVMGYTMNVDKEENGEYTLRISKVIITSGSLAHVWHRIRGINRENGI